ncbi:MAG: hypothetical protein JWL90_4119 [Chthoniobacteraceae bacterium]|nr:hypothetical protein [Chthoniobacteraceae bacterium]
MIALLRKELRALFPLALLIFGFVGALILGDLFTEFPDAQRLCARCWIDNSRSSMVVFILLFGIITGSGLLTGESTRGTLGFLDALPVSRSRVFFGKMIAASLVLAMLPILGWADDAILGLLSRQSTDAVFPWSFIGIEFLLEIVAIGYVLALAAAFSMTRQWFALVVGVVFWIFLWARARGIGWIGLFDPNELLSPGIDGASVRIPWRHLAAHLSVGIAALFLAWLGFLAMGDRTQHTFDKLSRNRFVRLLHFLRFGIVPVVWFAALNRCDNHSASDPKAARPAAESAFASAETKRYEFLFRESQRANAQALIAQADAVHDTVTRFLRAKATPARIVVDLASPVVEHAAGQANWTKIRIPLGQGTPIARLKSLLAHETTHVYIEQLSDGAMGRSFASTQFFHEGLATFVQERFFGSETDRTALRRAGAAATARGKVSFETLASNQTLGANRDPFLVYPLGEVFCRALVRTYGKRSPSKMLKALARKNAPSSLSGAPLWRDAMQSCGYNLDRVIGAYDGELALAMKEEADFIAQIPVLTAQVELEGDQILIRTQHASRAPGEMLCLVRINTGLSEEQQSVYADKDGVFRVPRARSSGSVFRYLLGWKIEGMEWPIFEPWSETTL